MAEPQEVITAHDFAQLMLKFGSKLERLDENFQFALDSDSAKEIRAQQKIAIELVKEYKSICEYLSPFSEGLKRDQFIEEFQFDYNCLMDKMEQAKDFFLS